MFWHYSVFQTFHSQATTDKGSKIRPHLVIDSIHESWNEREKCRFESLKIVCQKFDIALKESDAKKSSDIHKLRIVTT